MAVVPVRSITIQCTHPHDESIPFQKELRVVTLQDRRSNAPSQPIEWLLQIDLEDLLYPAVVTHGTNGAFYRLLARSGASGALPLRRNSVDAGLVTLEEFGELKALFHSQVRVFTLVPIPAVAMALTTYGPTEISKTLVSALDLELPEGWADEAPEEPQGGGDGEDEDEDAEEDGEDEEDEEEREREEEDEEDEEEDDDTSANGGSGASGGSGGSGSSGASGGSGVSGDSGGSGEADSRSRSHHAESSNSSEEMDATDVDGDGGTARSLPSIMVSPALEAQLSAFARWRASVVNRHRKGRAVSAVTIKNDRRSILHFFAWLHHRQGVATLSFSVFASPKMGSVAQAFVEFKVLSCSYARVTNVVGSLVCAVRFATAVLKAKGVAVSSAPVNELEALHAQCLAEARQQRKFAIAQPPKAWLDWSQCQRARTRCERAVAACDGSNVAEKLSLVRSCVLLTLLTALPPDRVAVYRLLQLGGSLKHMGGGSYLIDLSERGAHKTSAVFGPSRTTLTSLVAARIHTLVVLEGLQPGDYLFHAAAGRRTAPETWTWTRVVQAAFKRFSGVALSPKDCRSSFVTFLRDGDHGDETLRAAAKAMRHSTTMAASAHYDKHGSDRIVASAVSAADAFARRFA
jgi:uncharacterized membrane protein YgcG